MKQKLMLLLAGALAVFSFGAFTSVASAAEWSLDLNGTNTFPQPITSQTTDPLLTSNIGAITCATGTGTGQYTAATTGDNQYLFHGCKVVSTGEVCTTAGQPAGTITTTNLLFHNIMIDSTTQVAGGKPGILLTSNAGHFATFVCGGIFTVKVTGNGIIGEVTSPACSTGTFRRSSTLRFESIATGNQKYKQQETAGLTWDMTVEGFGITATASEDAEGPFEFTNAGVEGKMTCP